MMQLPCLSYRLWYCAEELLGRTYLQDIHSRLLLLLLLKLLLLLLLKLQVIHAPPQTMGQPASCVVCVLAMTRAMPASDFPKHGRSMKPRHLKRKLLPTSVCDAW
jgi:hypothetical protein